MTDATPIGRSLSITLLGADREHPAEDEIVEQAQEIAKHYGIDPLCSSGPYYEDGDERDREIARLKAALAKVLAQFWRATDSDSGLELHYFDGALSQEEMDEARAVLAGGDH